MKNFIIESSNLASVPSSVLPSSNPSTLALHPWFVTGFCDGEATFTISLTKDNRERKTTRRLDQNKDREIFSVHPSFAIALNIKDEDLVYSLQSYFGVGKIKQDISHNAIVFYVNSVAELTSVIIPFFDNYPLITIPQILSLIGSIYIFHTNISSYLCTFVKVQR